jgi:hypothetical protein
MYDVDFIQDGYVRDFYIAPVKGLHKEIRGKFRPMLPQDASALVDALRESEEKYFGVAAAAIAPFVVEWSLVDAKGGKRPIGHDTLLRVPRRALQRLIDIVSGFAATDIDPQWAPEQRNEANHTAYASVKSRVSPGEAALAADTKN